MQDMIQSYKTKSLGENSWIVDVADIRDYDISAKNPAKIKEIIHEDPKIIIGKIKENEQLIQANIKTLEQLIQ